MADRPEHSGYTYFSDFFKVRDAFDYYRDDRFVQNVIRHFSESEWEKNNRSLIEFSPKPSFRWKQLSDTISIPEKRSKLQQFHDNTRVDDLIRPEETKILEKEVFSEGLLRDDVSRWEKISKLFLILQNGEACIMCPFACTEGVVALIETFDSSQPVLQNVLSHCKDGKSGNFGIGAQYLSEVHGGSDVGANKVEAVEEDGQWKIYGEKFFCSAAHADYVVVTAKPRGSNHIATFIVPSWTSEKKEQRNGYKIDRIKSKLGTSELVTAEITFDGALAYPVGPLEKGLSNIVSIVLTRSRLVLGLSAAAFMTRATREALQYAEFRRAFGRKINGFPIVSKQLEDLKDAAQRSTAAAFNIMGQFYEMDGQPLNSDKEKHRAFELRELIMLQKISVAKEATDTIRLAMSIFGGHGVMEDFSALPRLYRDSAVNELWEGPRNVLLSQILRDLKKAAKWYPVENFVENVLQNSETSDVGGLSKELSRLLKYEKWDEVSSSTFEIAQDWDHFCERLFRSYQRVQLSRVLGSKS